MSTAKAMDLPLGLKRLAELDSLEVHSTRTWTGSTFEFRECSGDLLFSSTQKPKGWFNIGLSFDLSLLDKNGVEVINLMRPNTFCLSNVEVRVQGSLASSVRQKQTCLKPVLEINDAAGSPVYRMKGPWNQAANFQFLFTTLDKSTPLGAITKKWHGWRADLMTRKDDFIITFPKHLDLEYKAACIGAAVCIIHIRRRQRRGR